MRPLLSPLPVSESRAPSRLRARSAADAPLDPSAMAICSAAIAHNSKSFALASMLLPRAVRNDVAILYAWCRRADDAVDLVPRGEQRRAVERLRCELDGIFSGEHQPDPVLKSFQEVVLRHRIPRAYPEGLLGGFQMDALATRYRRTEDLLRYCYRVASTVGLMLCHVMGLRRASARVHAAHLGIAMQLTNICRDVGEDWARGRNYLPDECFTAEGVRPDADDLARRAAVPAVVKHLLDVADVYYASADRGLFALPLRCALGVRAARLVYAAIGAAIRRRGYDVLSGRTVVSLPRKLLLVIVACALELLEVPRRIRFPFRRASLTGVATAAAILEMPQEREREVVA